MSTDTGAGCGGSSGVQRRLCGPGGAHQLLLDLLLLSEANLLQLLLAHALPAVKNYTVRPEGAGCLLRVLREQVPMQQVGDLSHVVLLLLLLLLPLPFCQLHNLCREGPRNTLE